MEGSSRVSVDQAPREDPIPFARSTEKPEGSGVEYDQVSDTDAAELTVATRFVGATGTGCGVVMVTTFDGTDDPAAFTATSSKRYTVLPVSPVTV